MEIALKILVSFIVAFLSYILKWITAGGSIIVLILAFTILIKLGWIWAFPPVMFLTLGSLLSIFSGKRERRNYKQVMANGLMALLCALVEFEGGYLVAITVSFSDTVATEMGLKFAKRTYLITNFKEVPKGTSGGISFIGTFSGIMTILMMSLFGYINALEPVSVFLASSVGFFADSFIGATFENKGFFGNNTTNFLSTLIGVLFYVVFLITFNTKAYL